MMILVENAHERQFGHFCVFTFLRQRSSLLSSGSVGPLTCIRLPLYALGHDTSGTSRLWGPSIPPLLAPLTASERKRTGRICWPTGSRKKPLLSSHMWSSPVEIASPVSRARGQATFRQVRGFGNQKVRTGLLPSSRQSFASRQYCHSRRQCPEQEPIELT